ncbi:MAG: SBBP repeat-containing protein [Planctomycetota bacterium]
MRRYAPDGSLLWSRTHAGPGGLEDMGVGAACDEGGRIVAVGYVGRAVPGEEKRKMTLDAWVGAFDADGTPLWDHTHDGPGSGLDAALDAAIAEGGDILVAGYESTEGGDNNVWLRRYDAAGETLWTQTYDGPAHGRDRGTSVAIDPDGNILLSGHIDVPGEAWNALVRKYEPDGDLIWTRTYDGEDSVFDAANDIVTDAEGNVFVTGFEYVEGQTQDVLVRKYHTDGDPHWTVRCSGDAGGNDSGAGIATDADGFIYVAGSNFIREVEVAPGDCDPEDQNEDGSCPLRYDYDAFVRKLVP